MVKVKVKDQRHTLRPKPRPYLKPRPRPKSTFFGPETKTIVSRPHAGSKLKVKVVNNEYITLHSVVCIFPFIDPAFLPDWLSGYSTISPYLMLISLFLFSFSFFIYTSFFLLVFFSVPVLLLIPGLFIGFSDFWSVLLLVFYTFLVFTRWTKLAD